MSDRTPDSPADEGWRDIYLDDILKGVGSFINLVSDVVESVGSAVSQSRTPAARPRVPLPQAPRHLGMAAQAAGVREPIVDLFDEGEEIVLVIEWPYGDEGRIEVGVQDDVLSISMGGELPYSADLLLPGVVDAATLRQSYRNGISEIRLRRA